MSMCDIYDESVMVDIIRNGRPKSVPFEELKAGDQVVGEDAPCITVGTDAHQCEDSHYTGWVVYDDEGNSYFPEDFGAKLICSGDEEEEESA